MIEATRRVSIMVGVLVLVVGRTLAAILIFLGSATRVFSSNVKASACFSDVTGLRSGALVVLSGVSIGAVSDIGLGGACGDSARVELSIDAKMVKRLPADSRARLVTMGLLGDRLVTIVPGKATARLADGQVIAGEVPPDASAVIAEASDAFAVLTRIARRFDETLAETDLKGALGDVAAGAHALRHALDRAERGPGLLHLLLCDRQLEKQARAVGPALANVAAAAANAEHATGELAHASQGAAQIVDYVKSGQGTLGGVI